MPGEIAKEEEKIKQSLEKKKSKRKKPLRIKTRL